MILELVKLFLMSAVLIYASISDIKTMTASDKIYPFLMTIGLLNLDMSSLWSAALLFVISMAIALIGNMGGADVKTISCCAFIIKGFDSVYALLIACIAFVIVMPFIKKKFPMGNWEFPFIPFIAFGFIFAETMKIINSFIL